METAADAWSAGRLYHFLVSAVAPRPIAWISTIDASGRPNLAPFSWFNAVSADPPVLMTSFSPRSDGAPKDTLHNLRATQEYVVNVVPAALVEDCVATSVDLPPGVSEAEAAGLELVPSHVVRPPRLAASPVHFECRLLEERVFVGRNGSRTTMVLGEVVHVSADDDVLGERGTVDPDRLVLGARMGGTWYTDTGNRRDVPRPPAGQSSA